MTTLMLVRSFRESNLLLLLSCLKEAVPLCYALDHIHYSRWLSVFIHDLELLCVENPDMFIVQLNRKQSWGKNIQSRLFGDCILSKARDEQQNHEIPRWSIRKTHLIWEKSRFVTQRWMSSWKIEMRQLELLNTKRNPRHSTRLSYPIAIKFLLRWPLTHSLLEGFKCLTVYCRFLLKWFVTALDYFLLGKNNTKTLFWQVLFLDPKRLFRQAWKRTTLWSWESGKKLHQGHRQR